MTFEVEEEPLRIKIRDGNLMLYRKIFRIQKW
jgi:hypothetical protein